MVGAAEVLLAVGVHVRALELVGLALSEAVVSSPEDRAAHFALVARALVTSGDLDLARQVARRGQEVAGQIAEPSARSAAFLDVCHTLLQAKDFKRAREAATGIASDAVRAAMLAELVLVLLESENHSEALDLLEQALAVIGRASDSDDWATSMLPVTAALLASGNVEGTERAIRQVIERVRRQSESPSNGGWKLQIARGLLAVGDLDGANQLSGQISSTVERCNLLLQLAEARIRTEQLDCALITLRQAVMISGHVPGQMTRPTVDNNAIATLIAAGELDRAEEAAAGEIDPMTRAKALRYVAGGRASLGQLASAARLLAHAWIDAESPWEGWDTLAVVDPGSVQALAKILVQTEV